MSMIGKMESHALRASNFLRAAWSAKSLVLLAVALMLSGCATPRKLMPTPNVYALDLEQPYAASLPVELRTVGVNLLYATDRLPQPRENGQLDYGDGRDMSLAIGEAVVNIGGEAT